MNQKAISFFEGNGISKSWYYVIRYIAIITMFVDHLGKVLYATGCLSETGIMITKSIGRIAFPLFAFMLVESFFFTENRWKHLKQIGILFLLSELPFDLVACSILDFEKTALSIQNTILTLGLGFLYMIIVNRNWEHIFQKMCKSKRLCSFLGKTIGITFTGLFAVIAMLLNSDYSWRGILLIALFNFARKAKKQKLWQAIALTLFVISTSDSVYLFVYLTLIPIYLSRKVEILEMKFLTSKTSRIVCRYFYPAHLTILAVLKIALILIGCE